MTIPKSSVLLVGLLLVLLPSLAILQYRLICERGGWNPPRSPRSSATCATVSGPARSLFRHRATPCCCSVRSFGRVLPSSDRDLMNFVLAVRKIFAPADRE